MEERVLYGNLTVYRSRGAFLRRLEQFELAKASYDTAFSTNPQDIQLLIGRSQTCSDAVQPMQAFTDAELALKLEPDNMKAKSVQALALYTMSEFENSLVMNYRGYRIRRQPPYFSEGINQCVQTIQDCIGTNAGDVMLDFLPLIKKAEVAQAYAQENPKPTHVTRIPQPDKKKKLTQLQARKNLLLARLLAMKYLGPMAHDKFYLQDLVRDRRIASANAAGSREIYKVVKEALVTLPQRQEMLRAQIPYYSIKLHEKAESIHQDNYKKIMLEREQEANRYTVKSMIRQIEKALQNKQIDELLSLAERMQMFLDKKTSRTLPDKEIYISWLYRIVGEGYLCQYRFSPTMSDRSKRRRIAFLMGMPIGRPKSYDSVRGKYPFKFVDIKKATDKLLETLEMCENSQQRCWLYYELARFFFTQKNFSLGKYYASRCQREADEIHSVVWWVNGCFILMSGDMQRGNANEVRVQVDEALKKVAKNIKDSEMVLEFLKECAAMAADMPTIDDRTLIRQREKEILSVMTEEQRIETEVLLKRMSSLPRGRRFVVLPQKPEPWSEPERHKYKQRGLTVVPGPVESLRRPPRAEISGFQIFDF